MKGNVSTKQYSIITKIQIKLGYNSIKTQIEVSKFPKFIHFKLHIEEKNSVEIVSVIRMVLVPVYIFICTRRGFGPA